MSRTIEEKRKHVCTPHGETFCDVCYPVEESENPIPKIPLVFTPKSFDDLMERCQTGIPPGLAAMMAINWCHSVNEEMLQKDT